MKEIKDRKNLDNLASLTNYRMFEDVIGCKWSLCVLQRISEGVIRPGKLEKSINGISTKVLNERLKKLSKFGIIEKKIYPEIPPKVEYYLTEFGAKFVDILSQIEKLKK